MRTITAGTRAELRAAYLAGAGLHSLAMRAGIAEGTVLAHAKREGWSNAQAAGFKPRQRAAGGIHRADRAISRNRGCGAWPASCGADAVTHGEAGEPCREPFPGAAF